MSANKGWVFAAAVAAFVLPAAAPALASVITPVNVVASSELAAFGRYAVNTINGSGLTGLGHSTDPGTMWLSTGNGAAGGTADPSPSITFDLGSVKAITGANIWNYNEVGGTNRGITSFSFSSSLDGITYTAPTTYNLSPATGVAGALAQLVTVSASAEFIRLSNLVSSDPQGFVGLSEVQFVGSALGQEEAIPEPSSMALLIVGIAGCVFAVRRSQSQAMSIKA